MSKRTASLSKMNEKSNHSLAKKRKLSGPGVSKSVHSPVHSILQLQQTKGNQEVQRLLKSGKIQAKLKIDRVSRLTINKPNDKYEQEADRVADRVMRMPEQEGSLVNGHWSLGKKEKESSLVQRESTCPECKDVEEGKEKNQVQTKPIADQITPLVQRQVGPEEEEEEPVQTKRIQRQAEPEEEEVQTKLQRQAEEEEEEPVQTKRIQRQEAEEEEEPVQTKLQRQPEDEEEEPVQAKQAPNQTPAVTSNIESNVNSLKGGGQPLPESTRSYFESRFGSDFSQVRVHTGSQAAETAKSINAKAFTTGRNIIFGAGQYRQGTLTGNRLLAHELTHVVQQSDPTSAYPGFHFVQKTNGPRAQVQRSYNRNTYLSMVRAAVIQLSNHMRARKTLSGLLKSLYTKLVRSGNFIWRAANGRATQGNFIVYKPPGRGARNIRLQLELNEANPSTEKRGGYFKSVNRRNNRIVIFVHNNRTFKTLRSTLFHEGIHLAAYILKTQGAAALGSPKHAGIRALQSALSNVAAA
ncbi:MAG: eCIS core domain-containing protein [Planctomycetota bacterium]|jgi:hypothetical protein